MSGDSTPPVEAGDGSARDVFASDEAVDRYVNEVEGLFPQERTAIDRYFSSGAVLDVGCGVGRVAHRLHERGFDVTGIDVSEPMVAKARSLYPDLDFRVADVTDSGLPSDAFDHAVFSYFGLDYVLPESERLTALAEVRRLLKPGGIFLFSSHNRWYALSALLTGKFSYVRDLYLRPENRRRLLSRYRRESVPLGELEVYVSDPVHQWRQLRRCGFDLLDVVGKRDGLLRYFESQPYYVARVRS